MRSSSSSGANLTTHNNVKVPRSSSSATVRDGFSSSSNGHGRSASCERPGRLGFRQRYVSGEPNGVQQTTKSNSNSPQHHGHKRTNSTGGGSMTMPTNPSKRSPLLLAANNTSSNNSSSNSKSKSSFNSSSLPSRGCGARSLSGGAVEFFRSNPSYSHNSRSNSRQQQHHNNSRNNTSGRNNIGGSLSSRYGTGPHNTNPNNTTTTTITTTHVKPLGKNTWNGSNNITSRSHRNRPNLFSAQYFETENQNGRPHHHPIMNNGRGGVVSSDNSRNHSQDVDDDDDDGSTNNLSGDFQNGYPNLAEWIKKALELDLDADKISHIEMAIKEFEQKRTERDKSPELLRQTSTSLPYTCNDSNSIASSSSNASSSNSTNNTQHQEQLLLQNHQKSSLPVIRKRKETGGQTKIPKPTFY